MEYDFEVRHIKGSSNSTADSLSRLPVCTPGAQEAPYPMDASIVDSKAILSSASATVPASARCGPGQQLSELPTIHKLEVLCEAQEIMCQVQKLATEPSTEVASVTIQSVIGELPKEAWDILPLTMAEVAHATRTDKIYGKLYNAVRRGELDPKDPDIKKFGGIFDQLYIEDDVIFFGSRVVIPTAQQRRLLSELHYTHIGIVKMKNTARKYFFWPGITKDIEVIASKCEGCRKFRKKPVPTALCPWPFARRVMERVHIDYCEYKGRMILVMVDAYSKRIWTRCMMHDTTSYKTLAILFGWFCEESGFPTVLVSDNGPQFTAKEFQDKMAKWGVRHLFSPPYHPQSNGLAEKAVHVVKDKLKKMDVAATPVGLYIGLAYIGRIHGLTTQASTGRCPYEMVRHGSVPSLFPRLTSSAMQ